MGKIPHETEKEDVMSDSARSRGGSNAGVFGGMYGMAFVGAAVYFVSHATTFWMGVLGLLKAIVWPVLVMYRVLELLNLR